MRAYIVRRLLLVIPTLLIVTIVLFILIHLVPGDIIDAMQSGGADAPLDRPTMEKALGLDQPMWIQYGRWLGVVPQVDGKLSGVFQGNLGKSYVRREQVNELVGLAWPVTLELGIMALLISITIALSIGIYSAVRQDTWLDYLGRSIAIGFISVPNFWVAILAVILPAIWWRRMPPLMLVRFADDPIGNLEMFILPAVVLGMTSAGALMRIARTQVLEVLRQDYIRTAWAKGLRERVVVLRHVLKNAMIPVVTGLGLQARLLIGGTVIIENIFSLPGMGRLMITALQTRDKLVIAGVVLVFSVALLLINLIVDLTYAFLNPKVRYQ